jgi:hypothetical protein
MFSCWISIVDRSKADRENLGSARAPQIEDLCAHAKVPFRENQPASTISKTETQSELTVHVTNIEQTRESLRRFSHHRSSKNLAAKASNHASNARSGAGLSISGTKISCRSYQQDREAE